MQIETNIQGIDVALNLKPGAYLMMRDSGVGKSYFFNLLNLAAYRLGYNLLLLNSYTYEGHSDILADSRGKDIIIFDNADLYLTGETLDTIRNENPNSVILVALHDLLVTTKAYSHAHIEATNKSLKLLA